MTTREIGNVLVDIIRYEYFGPDAASRDAVYNFTHSWEVNGICRNMLPPHTVTPVEKSALEDTLADYCRRRGIGAEAKAASGPGWRRCRTRWQSSSGNAKRICRSGANPAFRAVAFLFRWFGRRAVALRVS